MEHLISDITLVKQLKQLHYYYIFNRVSSSWNQWDDQNHLPNTAC